MIGIFRERLQTAVNFLDIFNEDFEPLTSPIDLKKCYLPLISSPKQLIQKSNISLYSINSLMNFESSTNENLSSEQFSCKEVVMRNILKSFFVLTGEFPTNFRTFSKYCYEFICSMGHLQNIKCFTQLSFKNFEQELQYQALEEDSLHFVMDRLYLIGKKPVSLLNNEDKAFILTFFCDNFLVNFAIALTFIYLNMLFFALTFSDNVLRKMYSVHKDDLELSIAQLLSCKDFSIMKDFAIDFLQNKASVYYNPEIFDKNQASFLDVTKNLYYLQDSIKILCDSKINLGYEKINVVLAIILRISCLEDLDAGSLASLLKKIEEILQTSFDFMDFNLPKVDETLVYCLYEMLLFNFNYNYQEPTKKHFEMIHIVEKTYIFLFEKAIKDCEILLKGRNNYRMPQKDDVEMRFVVTKKLKFYYILLMHSSFYELIEKSLDLLRNITNLLHDRAYNLPHYMTLKELSSKSAS